MAHWPSVNLQSAWSLAQFLVQVPFLLSHSLYSTSIGFLLYLLSWGSGHHMAEMAEYLLASWSWDNELTHWKSPWPAADRGMETCGVLSPWLPEKSYFGAVMEDIGDTGFHFPNSAVVSSQEDSVWGALSGHPDRDQPQHLWTWAHHVRFNIIREQPHSRAK